MCAVNGILRLSLACLIGGSSLFADDWPEWLGPNHDSVWRETGIVEKLPAEGTKVRWRATIVAGYSGPSVTAQRVFVTDRLLAPGTTNPADPFQRGRIAGVERILCL